MRAALVALCGAALCGAAICAFGADAVAQAPLIDGLGGPLGYGGSCLGPNDDGSSAAVDLGDAFPGGVSFFGARYTSLFVNTNGNVTFSGPLATYRSSAFPVADQPMIAPYWADVDIRTPNVCAGIDPQEPETCHSPADNGVWWALEPGRVVVTWHRVGYYDCHEDRRMSFQLVLSTPPMCAAGDDFDVEFRYAECGWATGDRGGGVGGFGGEEAQAGFDAGNGVDFVEIPGSRESGIHDRLCMQSNVATPGIWHFRIRAGGVVCPDAGARCDTGMLGACGVGATECVAGTTRCAVLYTPADESCNGVDEDCDGAIDEGDLCASGLACLRGRCSEPCSEFGCAPGFYCDAETGLCLDDACADVECEAGERCVLGVCAGPCDGITCPLGRACRAGRCVDPCESVDCGECALCDGGRCVDPCEVTGCAASHQCVAGRCVEESCLAITCAGAQVCSAGACVDRCGGARCPRGERCEAGECVAIPVASADAGVDGGGRDAGRTDSPDAGRTNEPDAGSTTTDPAGCACRASASDPGGGSRGSGLGWIFALAAWARRRRRERRRAHAPRLTDPQG